MVDEITLAGNAVTYIHPKNSKCHLSTNGATSTLEYASAKDYPSIAASLKKLFSLSSAPAAAGQVMTTPATVISSAGDEKKEITAKIGQAKFALYHIGGVWDFLAGKVTNLAYPVWPKTVEDILAMAQALREGQLPSLLI